MKITKYRKYVNSSKYLDENSDEFLFDDKILVQIDIYDLQSIASSTNFELFPGKEQFRKDVISLLEDKYHFEIIEDVHDGKMQKGYFSNRANNLSLYLDTYLDLTELKNFSKDERAKSISGKMFCFVHIRISDHTLADQGDVLHLDFIEDNAHKYDRSDVTHFMKDEEIELKERDLYQYYTEAIEDLDDQIHFRIDYWVKNADRYLRRYRI